nr:MAG TPA: hypothetical protein [Caudoviricetes sp.]
MNEDGSEATEIIRLAADYNSACERVGYLKRRCTE